MFLYYTLMVILKSMLNRFNYKENDLAQPLNLMSKPPNYEMMK